MIKLTREDYLKVRHLFFLGQLPIDFVQRWCEEEERRYDVLIHILDNAQHNGFVGYILNRLITHLDKRYAIVLIYNKKNEIIKVF